MKKCLFIFMLLAVFCMNITVFAADVPTLINTQQTQEIQQAQPQATTSPPTPTKPPIPAPINVEQKNVDGSEYLIKTFEIDTRRYGRPEGVFAEGENNEAVDFNPELLVENGYEKDGFLFAHLTTEKKANESKKTKDITETVQVETQSKSLEDILKRLPSTKDYDADGFTGTLNLDTQSIVTEVCGYTTKTWNVSTVQEYPGLMYADPSYVPQSATKDGTALPLVDVKWVVTGTGLAGDTLVPTEYKATATYSKKVSSQVPSGYVTTANYKGTVTKTTVDTVNYIVTYIGTPIYVPTPTPEPTEAPIVETQKESFQFPWGILFGILVLATLCGGGVFLFLFFKSRQGIQIYNLIDKDYICIGRQVVDFNKPLLDLNHFKDIIQSNTFTFVLDKPTSKRLFGKNIAVTLDDVTVMHMVKGYNEEYRFNLELGGLLDVK